MSRHMPPPRPYLRTGKSPYLPASQPTSFCLPQPPPPRAGWKASTHLSRRLRGEKELRATTIERTNEAALFVGGGGGGGRAFFRSLPEGGNEKEEEEEGDSLSPSSTLKLGPEAASAAASLFCSGGVA